MQVSLTLTRDTISPSLSQHLARASNRVGIHQAMGLAIISIAKRSFNDASLRPTAWSPLANGQPARLRKSGTLAKSARVILATDDSVTVGSDRLYAAIHQLGGKTAARTISAKNGKALKIPGIGFRKSVKHPGSKIPARPYFPFYASGQPSPTATTAILQVLEKRLRGLI
jgi:phage gpG-like protein